MVPWLNSWKRFDYTWPPNTVRKERGRDSISCETAWLHSDKIPTKENGIICFEE